MCATHVLPIGGRSICVQITRERSYPLPIYWYHSKGSWLRYNFAAESFYILKICSRQTDRRTEGRTDGIAIASTALAMRELRRAVIKHWNILKFFLNNFILTWNHGFKHCIVVCRVYVARFTAKQRLRPWTLYECVPYCLRLPVYRHHKTAVERRRYYYPRIQTCRRSRHAASRHDIIADSGLARWTTSPSFLLYERIHRLASLLSYITRMINTRRQLKVGCQFRRAVIKVEHVKNYRPVSKPWFHVRIKLF